MQVEHIFCPSVIGKPMQLIAGPPVLRSVLEFPVLQAQCIFFRKYCKRTKEIAVKCYSKQQVTIITRQAPSRCQLQFQKNS